MRRLNEKWGRKRKGRDKGSEGGRSVRRKRRVMGMGGGGGISHKVGGEDGI